MNLTQMTERSNQPILKKINPESSLERLMLTLQIFGHLMQRAGKDPNLGKKSKAKGEGDHRG